MGQDESGSSRVTSCTGGFNHARNRNRQSIVSGGAEGPASKVGKDEASRIRIRERAGSAGRCNLGGNDATIGGSSHSFGGGFARNEQ